MSRNHNFIESAFTDAAVAAGVDTLWDAGYTWYMNAWVQAILWRYQQGSLQSPVEACAEELMYVYNSLEGTHYTSIDQEQGGSSFRSRTQYIFDLGPEVWGDCSVYLYTFTGAGTSDHPASTVQDVVIGDLQVDTTEDHYTLTVKKVDATNPTKGLEGAQFHVESVNGSFQQDIVTGPDGTYTLRNLDANTYAVSETAPPPRRIPDRQCRPGVCGAAQRRQQYRHHYLQRYPGDHRQRHDPQSRCG